MDPNPKPHILVVDDDPVFCRIFKRVAEEEGLEVTYFSSVTKAYDQVSAGTWDVAVIDYDLGRVTGVQFSHYLERMGKNLPIVLVSALKVPSNTQWPAPVTTFLSKKEKPEVILAEVVRLAAKRKAA